ncbi:MAG: DUF1540 domain-containing protein [Firmicutes bacterium]|nr:DUF1540 domain-containing protein [Bacillota bacterium]MTI69611.1 DUF1540 domain-containing protein [Bacillota bacterium]
MTNHNPIQRVQCNVKTCKYNNDGHYCTASSIQIQPMNAKNVQETDCATFQSNNMQG